jgi:hypothetical protein
MTYVANAHLAEGLRNIAQSLPPEPYAQTIARIGLAAARLDDPVVRVLGDEVTDWPAGLPGGALPGRPAEVAAPPSSASVIAAMRAAGFPMVDPDEAIGCPDGVVGCTGGHRAGDHD